MTDKGEELVAARKKGKKQGDKVRNALAMVKQALHVGVFTGSREQLHDQLDAAVKMLEDYIEWHEEDED